MALLEFIVVLFFAASSCAAAAAAGSQEVPKHIKQLYADIRDKGECSKALAKGFFGGHEDENQFSYCGDHLDDYGIIYIQGSKGALADMDIDCDGTQGGSSDDGRCESSTDTQSQTTFKDLLADIPDLNANIHPYVVFGNEGSKKDWATFDPEEYGIAPLSIIAVVCADKLVYGVWGDTNGDDGPKAVIGEASISLATACYGKDMRGDFGHEDDDVLYIAFTYSEAVPTSANWSAKGYEEFAESIRGQGDSLMHRLEAIIEEDESGGHTIGPRKGGWWLALAVVVPGLLYL